ncbi:MAG: hypothetical protein A2941_00905 [Candidatus Yanofskybacteria bacterium RIFCSPLOWO2_01_FULL_49_17]|uniref:Type II secretion system protein GspG C-terminal domain-containing protein n=1 Tax=Candidatus Yanofskybacteria bacterium RIFCSPLOWO2_01_FULL_49_17 TaxID=1802700 RepID=A0A1F8GQZ0_9BACT|nr:MAG: hypothetical protein A2941_00905 [Candidatus Yanofskybacteria bacterium RIFCSPLOWO2_01_FULL_49_17]
MKKLYFRRSEGFTLVELLVVIAIIGVLATLLLLQLGVARQRARDAKRIADVNQTRTAVELYFDDNSQYPQVATFSALASTPSGCSGSTCFVPKYLALLPKDPLDPTSPHTYRYAYNGNTKYQIWAVLEQWAQALNSDADIVAVTGWAGQFVDGSKDSKTDCVTPSDTACIYDQGQN